MAAPPAAVVDHVRRHFSEESADLILADVDMVEHYARRLRCAPRRPPSPRTPKAAIPAALRWEVWERDDFTCQHCGTRRFLSIDHVIAEASGGATVLENLQTLCSPCNSRKGAR